MTVTVLASLIEPDFIWCISRCFFLFVLDQWERWKFKRMCLDSTIFVCLCEGLIRWLWFYFFTKGSPCDGDVVWWKSREQYGDVSVPEVTALILNVMECPSMMHPWGFCESYSFCDWKVKHDRKCMLLYVLRRASVVHLHAFVWEIKCSHQANPAARARYEGFALLICSQSKLCEYSAGNWCKQLHSNSGCPGHSSGGVTRSNSFNTFYWCWRGVGGKLCRVVVS